MQEIKFKETEIGMIPEDWKFDVLGKHLYIKGRIGWKGLQKSEYLKDGTGVLIINGTQIQDSKMDWNDCGRVPARRYEESPEIQLKKNDIVMTKDGTLGKVAFIKELPEKSSVASGIFVIRDESGEIDPTFLFYYFKSPIFKWLIETRKEGSVIPHLYQRDFQDLLIAYPSVKEQKAIAKILFDLDSKIEVLQQQNKVLEKIGKIIFKQWFVNFEFPNEEGNPYKSSGGEMIESEFGKIPFGWKIKSMSELTSKFTTGLNPRKNFKFGEGDNFYVTIKNMTDNQEVILNNKCDNVDDRAINKINARADLKKNDILFSGVATIGRTFFIDETPVNWNINESIFTLRANKKEITPFILYNLLLSKDFQNYSQQLAIGSVQKGIRMVDLKNYKFILPKIDKQKYISLFFETIILKQKNNVRNINILSKIRDRLLQELMTGKIRVPIENAKDN
jgi:type I restriction enzyme, S subunit